MWPGRYQSRYVDSMTAFKVSRSYVQVFAVTFRTSVDLVLNVPKQLTRKQSKCIATTSESRLIFCRFANHKTKRSTDRFQVSLH